MKKFILIFTVLLSNLVLVAQKKDKVLLKIDKQPIYVSEFKELFALGDEKRTEKEFNADLELFINYHLKVMKAEEEQMDTLPEIKQELLKHKIRFSRPYFRDEELADKMLREAYDRLSYRIRASHILLKAEDNDTIEAYKKILQVKKELDNGASFNALVKKYSDDKRSAISNGDLGYFSAFQMVYSFENAAYNTPVGGVSDIVKTSYGYHILKVTDKKKREKGVVAGHIMVSGLTKEKKQKIDNLYQELQSGKSFETLAENNSDDSNSKKKGGKLATFYEGDMPKEFERAVFSLKEENEYTKPFTTRYGWHIAKLYEYKIAEPFEERIERYKELVYKGKRGDLIAESGLKKISKDYKIIVNDKAKEVFKTNKYKTISLDSLQETLLSINEQNITQATFLKYVRGNNPMEVFDAFRKESIRKYFTDKIEDIDVESRKEITKYFRGLAIFEIMKKYVWEVPAKEPNKVMALYNQNTEEYKKKGDSFKSVRGYVESDYQDMIEKQWLASLRAEKKVKINKHQLKKLKKQYVQ